MALRTAKRLAPQAIFLRGDFKKYSSLSKEFHAILNDFTPLVEYSPAHNFLQGQESGGFSD